MGPVALPPDLPVPSQTDPAIHSIDALLQGYLVRPHGQLPPVRKGGSIIPRKQRDQQDTRHDLRVARHQAVERVLRA